MLNPGSHEVSRTLMNSHEVSYTLTHSSRTLTHSYTLYQVWITIGREGSRDRLRMACSRTLTKNRFSHDIASSRTLTQITHRRVFRFGLQAAFVRMREITRWTTCSRILTKRGVGSKGRVRRVLWGFLGQLWGSMLALWNTCWEPFGVANLSPDEVQV